MTIMFGVEINASGGAQTVGEFKKAQEAIAKMKKEAASIQALSKALGITADEAKKLADKLGIAAEDAGVAVAALKDLKTAGQDVNTRFVTLNRGLGITADQFEALEKATGSEEKELKDLNRALGITTEEFKAAQRAIDSAGDELNELNDLQKLGGAIASAGGAIASAGIAAKVAEIGQEALQTGLKFEGLQATLENTLGSKAAADQVFGRLQTFAANTPNQLDETIQAFISLKQRGIEPTNDVLQKFGDIASSQGKSLGQFIEAVLDATTGENERLKEFGIAAKQSGDKVTFSFQGVNKTVEKTPESIKNALLAFGALDGVAGGMEKKAATLGGQFSNLTDNTEALQNEIFSLVQGPMIDIVTQANILINYFRELPAPIRLTVLGIAGFSGALVAAIAAVTAFELANGRAIVTTTVQSAALVKDAIITNAVAAAKLAAAAATGTLTTAQTALIASMAATAVVAGTVVGALAAIALAVDTFNKVTEAARETEKATANIEKSLASLTEVEKKHADAVGKAAASEDLHAAALKRTQEQLGPIQAGLDAIRRVFRLTTAVDESLRQQAVAFEEQATKADEITGKVFSLFSRGAGKLTDNELKLYKAAVDEATASIKAHIPIDEQDSNLKEQKLSLLAKSKTLIDKETEAREKSKKATEGAAAAEQKAIQEKAQAQAAAIKTQQDAIKEKAQEKFDQAQRDRAEKAAEFQRDRQEQFDDLQRTVDRRYQDLKQQREESFSTGQQAKAKIFQEELQRDSEAFQAKQQAAQKAFEDKLNAANQSTATAFTEAQRRASVAEQLAAAQTVEERRKILKESAAQVAQQQAIAKLQLADRPFNPDQILKLAQQVTGANQGTVEGAKQISDAIAAIQTEQQKQQEAADQQKRLAFESKLRADAQSFADKQKAEQTAYDQQKQSESKAFAESERAIADQWAQLQREAQKLFAAEERAIQRATEDENRSIQKTFAAEQRAADLANAEQIKKVLDSAKTAAPQARRAGGDVQQGQPYLVGEEGPELIFPNRSGFVATARETAAMMAIPSLGVSAQPNTVVIQDSKNAKLIQELIAQTRTSNAHLAAIASRKPIGNLNQTTITNEYNTRNSRGLPR